MLHCILLEQILREGDKDTAMRQIPPRANTLLIYYSVGAKMVLRHIVMKWSAMLLGKLLQPN